MQTATSLPSNQTNKNKHQLLLIYEDISLIPESISCKYRNTQNIHPTLEIEPGHLWILDNHLLLSCIPTPSSANALFI